MNHLYRDFTMDLLDDSQIFYKFTIYFANSLLFTVESRIYYELTYFLADRLSIQFLFHELIIFFAYIPEIHYLFHKFLINSLFFPNSLTISRLNYEFTFFEYSLQLTF